MSQFYLKKYNQLSPDLQQCLPSSISQAYLYPMRTSMHLDQYKMLEQVCKLQVQLVKKSEAKY